VRIVVLYVQAEILEVFEGRPILVRIDGVTLESGEFEELYPDHDKND